MNRMRLFTIVSLLVLSCSFLEAQNIPPKVDAVKNAWVAHISLVKPYFEKKCDFLLANLEDYIGKIDSVSYGLLFARYRHVVDSLKYPAHDVYLECMFSEGEETSAQLHIYMMHHSFVYIFTYDIINNGLTTVRVANNYCKDIKTGLNLQFAEPCTNCSCSSRQRIISFLRANMIADTRLSY